MENNMLGYDKAAARAFILKELDPAAHKTLADELPALVACLLDAHLAYLHLCGALDADGDTGEGEYDEDDALEYLLDAVADGADDEKSNALAQLIEAFLIAQDMYMEKAGLLG